MKTITKSGTRAVITYQQDAECDFHSRLWVNCTPGQKEVNGDATLIQASHKTLDGAQKWAQKMLSA